MGKITRKPNWKLSQLTQFLVSFGCKTDLKAILTSTSNAFSILHREHQYHIHQKIKYNTYYPLCGSFCEGPPSLVDIKNMFSGKKIPAKDYKFIEVEPFD